MAKTPKPNAAQIASPSYRLPALDADFLLGESMRGTRFLLEYEKADQALKAWGVHSTIVVFGSARVGEDHTWYKAAREFARIASTRGGALLQDHDGVRENVIATGGGPGIMEAANRGAHDVGAPTVGFNITLPREQEPNPYTTPALTFRFHYFAMRKMHFAMHAKALVVFPGGFGTFDELFELLTLTQTGKTPRIPIVLVDQDYWQKAIDFATLRDNGMVSAEDLALLEFAADGADAWAILKQAGVAPAAVAAGNLPLGGA